MLAGACIRYRIEFVSFISFFFFFLGGSKSGKMARKFGTLLVVKQTHLLLKYSQFVLVIK